MAEYELDTEGEVDEIAELVEREGISAEYVQIQIRPDVTLDEQERWRRQDPDYPPEHYRCLVKRGNKELVVHQTVGADYPDEEEDADNSDLYRDSRDLLLSAEFLIESAALKANSIDQASDLNHWISNGYCETDTPEETYQEYRRIRSELLELLDEQLYRRLVRLALEAELERDDESEELT